jgi:hypothetical protein
VRPGTPGAGSPAAQSSDPRKPSEIHRPQEGAAHALAGDHRRYSLGRVPGAIFTDPEIASVGLTAEEAQAQGHKVKVGEQEMTKVGRARVMGETKGFVKFVVDADSDELLGMHVLAYHGADLLHEGVIAMSGTGTIAPLIDCICIHPTFSEGVKAAAGNLREVEIPDAAGDLPVEEEVEPTGRERRAFDSDIA